MWFRVELHKDGSVASCETVEGKLNDGKHVFYVEADTKEKALAHVVLMHRRHLERSRIKEAARRARRANEERCRDCHQPKVAGKTLCEEHLRRQRESQRRLREHGARPPRNPDVAAVAFQASKKRGYEAQKAFARQAYGMTHSDASRRRSFLRETLAAYLANPREIHAWLVTELAKLGVRPELGQPPGEPFAFEAAAE